MAGPRTRGEALQRQAQGEQQPAKSNLGGSNQPKSVSKSVSSDAVIFVTPTSSSREIAGESHSFHPQAFESYAYGKNGALLGSDELETTVVSLTRRRGRTQKISLSKRREANETLTIQIDDCIWRIVGKDSQYFITEGAVLLGRLQGLMFESGPILIPMTEMTYTARLRMTFDLRSTSPQKLLLIGSKTDNIGIIGIAFTSIT